MKMLSFAVEDRFVELIDEVIARSGRFSSRSEFLKDSIRRNIEKEVEVGENMKKFSENLVDLRKKAYARGFSGRLLTKKEKAKIANKHFADKGIKVVNF